MFKASIIEKAFSIYLPENALCSVGLFGFKKVQLEKAGLVLFQSLGLAKPRSLAKLAKEVGCLPHSKENKSHANGIHWQNNSFVK